jgi:hypothetical protein
MNRYGRLLVGVLLAAVVVSGLARLPRSRARTEAPPAVPVTDLAIVVGDSVVTPMLASVPKGHRVRLHVRNAAGRSLSIRLAGYEREVSIPALAAGSTWDGEFLAELPGEDFAWLIDGEPVGRLSVTGSHLVEGHR